MGNRLQERRVKMGDGWGKRCRTSNRCLAFGRKIVFPSVYIVKVGMEHLSGPSVGFNRELFAKN